MKITSRLKPMTPTELFKLQVQGNMQSIRLRNSGYINVPAQFGGLKGQRTVLEQSEVIEVTDFSGDQ